VGRFLLLVWACAAVLQAQAAVTATAAPVSVTFNYQMGATLPAAQTVSVRASAGTPTFATAVTGANSLWLTVGPDNGKLPGNLSVRANPTSLAAGTYTAAISVLVTGVVSPVNIPVTLIINSAPPQLTLSGLALSFAAPPTPVPSQMILLSTNGAPISFTASAGAAWLQVAPASGIVLPGEIVPLTVTVDPTGLDPQAAPYVAKVTVVGLGLPAATKSQNITVSLTVNNSTPTITSVWPPALPVNGPAQTITIRGTGFYKATVAKVQSAAAPLSTTLVSSTALLAVVPAALLTTAGSLNVLVSNPAPGGDSTPVAVSVGNVLTVQAVVNVASYAAAALSPGELATIFGTNLGPATAAAMSITNGFVDTTVAGVSVTVDGHAAPLLYVSQNQITIQVPYEVAQGAGKQVMVANGANPPAVANVTIAAAIPGLFTVDSSGSGQAAVLNYNATTLQYTLNSSSNPAKLGDTVVLYLTGEGDYATALTPTHTGLVIPATLTPLPQLNPLPAVTIGGATATVNYAGPIVGSIIGLLQINTVIPAGSTTGTAVPVSVAIGGASTQANVTISVHP